MDLRTTGMEFASEMVVKATLHKMKITEVPTTLSPDGRSRAPHLRSWRDGWRHLGFYCSTARAGSSGIRDYCSSWLACSQGRGSFLAHAPLAE